jgi:hypothetical protein
VDVRPATPDSFPDVLPLLCRFGNTRMRAEDWRRMLFDLPWPTTEPHRGYMLLDGGRVVGFLGTIISTRMIHGTPRRFCNLAAWIVEESYRASSIQLLLPVLGMRDTTIVNLTASIRAHEIFLKLGFATLEDRQVLVRLFPHMPGFMRGMRVTTDVDAIREDLDPPGRTICDDMRGTHARQALVIRGSRRCHVVATRSPWIGPLLLAHVQYASDWGLLREETAIVASAFHRAMGTVGLRIDGRRFSGKVPLFAKTRRLALTTLYRPGQPDVTPGDVDGLYTELVGQRW